MNCAMIDTDMNTFDCSRFCDDFCKPPKEVEESASTIGISALYPGLTEDEKRFVDKNPKKAVEAYWLSWRAEGICKTVYFVSDTNDESDACRHFVWAALLNVKFGQSLASELLDAHEQNPDEPAEERSMDLANSRRGLIISSDLIKSKKTQDTDFLNQFQLDLKSGKIIVLKKKVK